jgi:nitric oxide reductase large subunit
MGVLAATVYLLPLTEHQHIEAAVAEAVVVMATILEVLAVAVVNLELLFLLREFQTLVVGAAGGCQGLELLDQQRALVALV